MTYRIRAAVLVAAVLAALFAASPAHAAEHRNYVAVGDSITWGVGTSKEDGSMGYPGQANVRGMGVGGSCLAEECAISAYRWLPDRLAALAYKPRTLVSNFGVNDLGQGLTADMLASRAIKFRRDMKALGYRVVFSTVVPPPHASTMSYIQTQRLAYNNWVRSQPTFVDYAKALQCKQWLCPGLTNSNDVHLDDAGAKIMAGVLLEWIERDAG